MKADILREKFLSFFKTKKHKIIESDSLVPEDDATILFTPAGMNQFKKQFLGFITGFTRAATCQRCLRTDDLERVGKTPSHHTFFEMLGNFSFGDYFEEEAIIFAWEFLTQELGIKKERLWVSIYKDDEEAARIWRDKIKVPQDKIIKLGDKENFWPAQAREKGPNGPCGPCSEIFFDQGNNLGCKRPDCNPSCKCGRFVEVWNLVFTQFNRKDEGILEPLPKKNIDTGMGLERLAAVMQGVHSNFETDLFKPIIKEIADYELRTMNYELIYAIADHIRAIAFAIYDGILPSNEARGYVVRKLIRKSTLHLRTIGINKPFLYKLVPVVSSVMKVPYPELDKRRENIAEIILAEEKKFISTLESSNVLFKEKFSEVLNKPNPSKTGKIAFQLYDTYGIPPELTLKWLQVHNLSFSQEAFNQELAQQKMRSKLESQMKGDVFAVRDVDFKEKETKFLGYKNDEVKAKIIKIIKEGKELKKTTAGEEVKIILDKTVFYPESGGQVGDTGEFLKGKNIFSVLDTQKFNKAIVHIGRVSQGSFKKNDLVTAKIDRKRRLNIARSHTATHLLQAALRKILGLHIQQQGSLVAPDRLRFDFTHFKNIAQEELERIEERVNNYIIDNYSVIAKQTSLQEAKRQGALAFFGEKYEDKVRLVSIGDVSCELCGGTHLDYTGGIGIFKIVQEGSVASGVRRIEAQTAFTAHQMIKEEKEKLLQESEKKSERIKELEKQLKAQKFNFIVGSLDKIIQDACEIKGIKVITEVIKDLDMDFLRKTVDLIKEKTGNSVIVLGSTNQGKAMLVVGVTEDLCQRGLDAQKLILPLSEVLGGSGGGRKDFAQAGGNKPENFPAAFEKLKEIL